MLPTNLGMDLLIAELSVHREIINGGVKKDQCLLTHYGYNYGGNCVKGLWMCGYVLLSDILK